MYTIRDAVESFIRRLQSEVTDNVELINRNDLHETTKIPGIILQGPDIQENLQRYTPPGITKEFETDEGALTFESRDYPHFYHLDFTLIITCSTSSELIDLQGKVIKFFLYNSILDVDGENIHLHEITPVGGLDRPNLSNLRQATGRYRMEDVVVYSDNAPEAGKLIEDRIFEFRDLESEDIIDEVRYEG